MCRAATIDDFQYWLMSKRNTKEYTWGHLWLKFPVFTLAVRWCRLGQWSLLLNPTSVAHLCHNCLITTFDGSLQKKTSLADIFILRTFMPKIHYWSGCSFVVCHLKKGWRRRDLAVFYVVNVFHLGQQSLQIQPGSANVDLHWFLDGSCRRSLRFTALFEN